MSAAAATPCPVCAEPLEGRPERCFRCETALAPWWSFEQALGEAPAGEVSDSAVLTRDRGLQVVAGMALSAVVGGLFVMMWLVGNAVDRGSAPAATPVSLVAQQVAAATASTHPSPIPPRVVRYRVQRGDSLWRIAAALTGDGRRWSELFPGRAASGTLEVGSVLEVTLTP